MNKDPKLYNCPNPFDICKWYNICIIQYTYYIEFQHILTLIPKDKCQRVVD